MVEVSKEERPLWSDSSSLSEEESDNDLSPVMLVVSKELEVSSWLQANKTSTFLKKVWEFIKIQFLGHSNIFEEKVVEGHAKDCGIVAKHSKVSTIDLRAEASLSVEELNLVTLHIPHPLVDIPYNEQKKELIGRKLRKSPVVIFLHGLGGQMSQFEPLLGVLSLCLEVISLDLPGFGNSKMHFSKKEKMLTEMNEEQKDKVSRSVRKMAKGDFCTDNIIAILFRFIRLTVPEDKKIVFVGHSMGTHLAIHLAKRLPRNKVESMVLLSPPPLEDDIKVDDQESTSISSRLLSWWKWIIRCPYIFNAFRVWDRLEGLESLSVSRQLDRKDTETSLTLNGVVGNLVKVKQLRWNLDIDTEVILNYMSGFRKVKYSDLIAVLDKLNYDPEEEAYQKILLITGVGDQVTPSSIISDIDSTLTKVFQRKVSQAIRVNNAGHSLLLAKPEFINGIVLNYVEKQLPERLHLSPAWVLKVKSDISGDKWGLKNEEKWLELKPMSSNITRFSGRQVAPLLGMKTLREGDLVHSPALLENAFYGPNAQDNKLRSDIKGNLIAIVDISANVPPYNPSSLKEIAYYKCATVSKVVPDLASISRFVQLVDNILLNNTVENPLIAVHCHYGFNRTGFLICCYLIERLLWSVKEAITSFQRAKPPGIKHIHFIDALYVRYEC